MADLQQHKIFTNTNFEILTDEGFKDFKGVIKGINNSKLHITFDNGKVLKCTPKHKLMIDNISHRYAKDLKIGDVVYGDVKIQDIQSINDDSPVYELLEVSDNHRYFANGILSHQCLILDELAFIDDHLVDEFWKSVYPTISRAKTSKIIIASTPNGKGNLFHQIYSGGEKNDNGFNAMRIEWDEIPGRDEKWKVEQIKALGSMESFMQEFACVCKKTLVSINTIDEPITIENLFEIL